MRGVLPLSLLVVAGTTLAVADNAVAAAPTVSLTTTALPGSNGAHHLGANQRWVGDADGALDGGEVSQQAMQAAKAMGLDDLRYPGGTVANLFDWSHAQVGSPPGCQTAGGFVGKPFTRVAPDDSRFTIDAAGEFADGVGASVNVMVPMINRTPQGAVDFINAVKARTGATKIVAEIGNEPYQTSQRYWRSSDYDTRLHQYIYGGKQEQKAGTGDYANNLSLFVPGTCDLRNPATADGTANQTYVPRFGPIATSPAPTITVAGKTWRYEPSLGPDYQGQHVFTLSGNQRTVVFGDGSNGAKPEGTMTIHYTVANQAGFNDYYRKLHDAFGSNITVCSGWGRTESGSGNAFVAKMNGADKPYDCVAMHQYAPMPPSGESGAKLVNDTFDIAANWAGRLDTLNDQIHNGTDPNRGARRLIVSEFGTLDPNGYGGKFIMTLQQARLLVSQFRHQVDISEFATLRKLYTISGGKVTGRSASGYLATMFAKLPNARPVKLSGVPAGTPIKPVAVRSGGQAGILAVNTSVGTDWSGAMKVPGLGASCLQTYRLVAAPLADLATTKVRDSPTVRKVGAGEAVTREFPAHSVTLLKWLPRKADGTCAAATW